MPRVCDFTGKRTTTGNTYRLRGKAKYLGGVGKKITGINKRVFKPNLQRIRIAGPNGETLRRWVCAQCIRSGNVTKPVKRKPFTALAV